MDCADWFSGDKPPNAADYHVVVVDAARLSDIIRQERGEKATPFPQIKRWQGWLGQLRERLRKLIKTGGMIVAIVDQPATAVGFKPEEPVRGWPVLVSSADWMPIPTSFRSEEGKTLEVKEEAFRRYMNGVKNWSFYFEVDTRASLQDIQDEHGYDHIEVDLKPIAVNLQQLPIAATVAYTVHKKHGQGWSAALYARSGELHLLPPPTAVSLEEGLRTVLEDFCGFESRSPDPPWITEVSAPGEPEAVSALKSAEATLTEAQQAVDAAAADAEKTASYKRVLSQKGPVLQEAVREIFESMGIQTDDSPVSDEFVLADSHGKVLVEVTGSDKSVSTRDLSQLIKDLGKYVEATGEGAKGLFIANPWKDIRPVERDTKDKPMFPDDLVKTSRPFSIALLSTIELFNAYCAVKEGKLTVDELMLRIRETTGIVTLVE